MKEFLSVYLAFETFEHYLWGVSNKPIIVLTDNKSVTKFFQAKVIPGNLWNAVDYVLSFNFVIGQIPGKPNVAAEYLSRINLNLATKMKFKLENQIPVKKINISFQKNTPKNQLCHLAPIEDNQTIKDNFQIPTIVIENEESESETMIDEFTSKESLINSLDTTNPLDEMNLESKLTPLNLEREQMKDLDIQKAIVWIKEKIRPDTTYSSYDCQKYHKQLNRLIVDYGIRYRKSFDHTGRNFTKQIVVPRQLREELLFRIHNSKLKGHLGITKTITEFRKKSYFPGFTEFLIVYINNCLSCLQTKSPKHENLTPPLNPVTSNTSFPADLIQVDIVGQLPKSGGYSYVVTAMDVFSKYMFAQPITSPSAETVAKILMQCFLRHSNIPLGILTAKGSVFTSKLIQNLSEMLEFKLTHATVKHAQTIGLLERSHGPLKRYLKIYENQLKHDWHKYVNLAVFQHNTSYHTVLGCPPTLIFHGRIPMNPNRSSLQQQNTAKLLK